MSEAAAAQTGYVLFAGRAYDPTAAGGAVAWQRPGGTALLRRGDETRGLPGSHPALGGARIAWREDDGITVAEAATLGRLGRVAAPEAGALAVSDAAVAWRTRDAAGTDRIVAAVGGGAPQVVRESRAPAELGRPALAGGLLLCHEAGPRGSHLLVVDLTSGAAQVLRSETGAQLTNPATDGARLLYVHATGETQQLRAGPLAPADPAGDQVLLVHHAVGRRDREHEPGRRRHRAGYPGRRRAPLPPRARPGVVATLWTTALAADAAYVTRLRAVKGSPLTGDILSVAAPPAG